jgi:hypothetical protein
MITKLNLFKNAITRVENDHEFMANTLKQYCEFEKISESELISILDCSLEDYYKLALCKSPDITESDFKSRLAIISEYVNIDTSRLTKVIKHVHTIQRFRSSTGSILMAARDKENGKDAKK